MRSLVRVGLVIAMLAVWSVGASDAQEVLTKSDRRGPVSVAVTLAAPPTVGTPLKAKVVLDTHSVALDGITFDTAVVMRTADGTDVAPTAVEQATGSGHHREAVLVFPAVTAPGMVRIVVKNVGGVTERMFAWESR